MLPELNIDLGELRHISKQLYASEKQFKQSILRAVKRTNITVGKLTRMELLKKLDLRRTYVIRRRIKKLKNVGNDVAGLWLGMNQLSISEFKGRAFSTSTGVSFKGKNYPGAFFGKYKGQGRRRVLIRTQPTRVPIREVTKSIEKESIQVLESKILQMIPNIFFEHFKKDLSYRVKWLN